MMSPDQLLKAGEVYAALGEIQQQMNVLCGEHGKLDACKAAEATIRRLLENSVEMFYDIMVDRPKPERDVVDDMVKVVRAMRGGDDD